MLLCTSTNERLFNLAIRDGKVDMSSDRRYGVDLYVSGRVLELK